MDDASVMLECSVRHCRNGNGCVNPAIEAYVSLAHPLTDASALEAIRLINLWLPKAVDDGHNWKHASRWRLVSIWRAWRLTVLASASHATGAAGRDC